jgi:GT2 family glycosyltransferase
MSWEGAEGMKGEDLGFAYNRAMREIQSPDDWVCFIDGDAINVSSRWWFRLLEAAIEQQPDAGLFGCYTVGLVPNRSDYQMLMHLEGSHDMREFYKEGWDRFVKFGAALEDVTNIDIGTRYKPLSGVAMCIQKRTWDEMGGVEEGHFFFVDHAIHKGVRNLGNRVFLVKGWVLYHFGKRIREYAGRPPSRGGETF